MAQWSLAEHPRDSQNIRMSKTQLTRRVLVLDDDDLVPASLRLALPGHWSMTACSTADEVWSRSDLGQFSAAFVDMHLTGDLKTAEGLEVIGRLRTLAPTLECVAMSGDLDRKLMEQGLEFGASRFLGKPIVTEEFLHVLEKIEALLEIRETRETQSQNQAHNQTRGPMWIGNSAKSQDVLRQIASLKGEPGPILLEGESGCGKEVAAFLLHQQELPRTRPFIRVNLGAIPESVFESEMFGHMKGAFTGADQNRAGLIEAAAGGDLFLDEIEALPLANQAKLLRFLESGETRRVGARESHHVQVRVIVATNRSLSEMVKAGEFREDLLWRVSGRVVRLPALRDRREDIPLLAEHFLSLERPRRNKHFAEDALQLLQRLPFTGNVRELKRLCEQVSLHAPLPVIREQDLRQNLPASLIPAGAVSSSSQDLDLDLSLGLSELTARYEAYVIRQALTRFPEPDLAAEKIGISRSSMYKKMKDYGIERL
jgi:DNA-binding NtrC family response regulator